MPPEITASSIDEWRRREWFMALRVTSAWRLSSGAMGYVIIEFEATPNPNALKLHLNQPISNGTISYLQPEHGAEHAVASKLFAIPGVRSVMLCGDFLTVNKDPGAEWRSIKAAVKRTLASVDEMERIQGF